MQVTIEDQQIVMELKRQAVMLDRPVGELVTAMLSVCLVRDEL